MKISERTLSGVGTLYHANNRYTTVFVDKCRKIFFSSYFDAYRRTLTIRKKVKMDHKLIQQIEQTGFPEHFQERESDYPVEDIFGDEIMSNDIYFIISDGV